MKYLLKTETNDTGNLVFSKERQGRIFIYLAKDENGNISPVSKNWIIENQNSIVNVRVNGDTIVPVGQNKKKTQDFGEKIGGAKKDLSIKGLCSNDFEGLTIQQVDSYMKKDKLWPKITTDELIAKGYDKIMALYVYRLRNCMPAKPVYLSSDNESVKKTQKEFYKFYDIIEDVVSKHLKYSEISQATEEIYKGLVNAGFLIQTYTNRYSVAQQGYNLINKKLIKHLDCSEGYFETEALNMEGYLSPREKAILLLHIFPLDGYRFYAVASDNRIKLGKETKSGFTTNYHYEYIEFDKFKSILEKHSLSCSIDEAGYNINKLLQKVRIFAVKYYGLRPAGILALLDVDTVNKDAYELLLSHCVDYETKSAEARKERDDAIAEIEKRNNPEPTETSNRKQRLKTNLSTIERNGPTMRNKSAVGQDFIDTFGIRGGEFGNWVNEEERQLNMNMCYDSFADLARVLCIPKSAIAMGHRLNIAFGARGSGNALAHYEPAREVINLTRMKGAGSLAHEYFHAIDDMYAKSLNRTGFASTMGDDAPTMKRLVDALMYKEVPYSSQDLKNEDLEYYKKQLAIFNQDMVDMIPDSTLKEEQIVEKNRIINNLLTKTKEGYVFIDLSSTRFKVDPIMKDLFLFINKYSLNYRMTDNNKRYLANKLTTISHAYQEYLETKEPTTKKKHTDFFKNAEKLSGSVTRTGHGYWNSKEEMCARAFACYVMDKLAEQGYKNDYLCGHAEATNVNGSLGYPVDDERIAINKAFDELFMSLKNEGFFSK